MSLKRHTGKSRKLNEGKIDGNALDIHYYGIILVSCKLKMTGELLWTMFAIRNREWWPCVISSIYILL